MKRELSGVLGRDRDQPVLRDSDGKTRLVYNLFDGLAGRKIRVAVEEIEEEEVISGGTALAGPRQRKKSS